MTSTIASPMYTANDLGIGLLRQPSMVLFGPGQRRQIARVVQGIAERVLMVTDSRIVQRSPISRRDASPWNLRSCGWWPTEAKGKIRVPAPTVV
jgi:hypothetical protein